MAEKISDAEFSVMEALWERAPLTANEVSDRVAEGRGWSVQTVKTLLSRLMAKDVIAADQDGRRFFIGRSCPATIMSPANPDASSTACSVAASLPSSPILPNRTS